MMSMMSQKYSASIEIDGSPQFFSPPATLKSLASCWSFSRTSKNSSSAGIPVKPSKGIKSWFNT